MSIPSDGQFGRKLSWARSPATCFCFSRGRFPGSAKNDCLECRVPAVYLTLADSWLLAFLVFGEINKLRVISWGQNSDSPASTTFKK